jgi:beta-glucanase (GH16 family)
MKRQKGIPVLATLLIGVLLTYAFVINLAVAQTAVFPMIADFEDGVPPNWFVYGDWGNITIDITIPTVADDDPLALPGQVGPNNVLSVTANVPTWAGFGAGLNPVQDWSDYDALSFWFYGENSGTSHEVEIQTVGGDNRRAPFVDDFTGWRQIILPFHTFGAGGTYDVTQVNNWVFVLDGMNGWFLLDNLQLVNLQPFADFEGGVPTGWFVYGDWGNIFIDITNPTIPDSDPLALPGQVGPNDILSVTATVPTWGGFGAGFTPTEDWSDMQGVSFWFYGENSGTPYEFEIQTTTNDNRRAGFIDDFAGWQLITLPFFTFGNTPYDVSQVTNWVFILDGMDGTFKLDDVAVYGDAGTVTLRVQFAQPTYAVLEGETVTLTVGLNAASDEIVTVNYETADGTADGSDYVPVSGTLTFDPGILTQTITVETIDNNSQDGNRDFTVVLSDPVNAQLGVSAVATVTILDDEAPNPSKMVVIDDFEDGLYTGLDANGLGIGFVTWGDTWNGTTVAITTTTASAAGIDPIPGKSESNQILDLESFVVGWGGFTHAFANEDVDTWVSQDWSAYEGVAFWYHGTGSGTVVFIDILENRNPGSTTDDAERWSYEWVDNVAGWQFVEIPFSALTRKEIGNGAPNDGWTGEAVHGWALGTISTGGNVENRYVDDFGLLVRMTVIDDFEDGLPSGTDANGLVGIGFVTWGDTWNGTTVAITTTSTLDAGLPPVPGKNENNQVIDLESMVVGWGGFTHAFANEDMDTWVSQDWSTYEGVCFWYYGTGTGTTAFIDILENRNPGSTTDDAERWSYEWVDNTPGWQFVEIPFRDLIRKEIGNGAPNDGWTGEEVHGWALGTVSTGGNVENRYVDDFAIYGNIGGEQELRLAFAAPSFSVVEGETAELIVTLNMTVSHPVSVTYATAESNARPYQYTPASGTLTFPAGTLTQTISIDTYHDGKHTRDVRLAVNLYEEDTMLGFQRRAILTIVDIDLADPRLVDDFQAAHPFIYVEGTVDLSITTLTDDNPLAVPDQWAYEDVLTVEYDGAASFGRVFAQGQDWSAYDGLSFWFYGQNSGETFTFQLRENMAATTADVDPDDWVLVWSDEFDGPAGTPPNPNVWKYEVGDGALNNIVGWGNSEFQYYTDSSDNSFMDGDGNLVIRLQDTGPDTDLVCWYGPCEYTSARLLTQDRLDFEYGRIKARVKVPGGRAGLWPAFWMLGSNIPEVGWPQSGEIDIMEYVSRLPNEIFGTIHGPGYQGGASFGNIYNFGEPVANDYHTFAVEWMPDLIIWYVDDIQYHQAVPADVAPNEWVFNHPFFMLLNAAIGGNFGGAISGDMTFPQDTLVDYVRVYQAADTAERFEAGFVDDFTGWRKINLPFSSFTRSTGQPDGAPNDGLTLTEVWGYDFILPADGSGLFHLDRVYLEALVELTPAEMIDNLIEDVVQLVAAGELRPTDGIRLINYLNLARFHLENGRSQQAIHHLNLFMADVERLVRIGRLNAGHGEVLVTQAQAIIAAIENQ